MEIHGTYNELLASSEVEHRGMRLSSFLKSEMNLSTRLIAHAKADNLITVNGKVRHLDYTLKGREEISLKMVENSGIEPEEMDIKIEYEDEDVLVINKEPFIVVHPTHLYLSGTLMNGLRHYALSKGEDYKPHIVNRLDRDTSGLMIVAKNRYSHFELMKQMAEGRIVKKYLALVWGKVEPSEGLIDEPIYDQGEVSVKRIVDTRGKEARTKYRVIETVGDKSVVELELLTGRTHQIRVHMSNLGYPLVGDKLYGIDDAYERQLLHSYCIAFKSPRRGGVEIKEEYSFKY